MHPGNNLVITKICNFEKRKDGKLPLFIEPVFAGFPSPADDFIDKKLDLNEHLIKHPTATFFVRVAGDSMQKAGIHNGDILIVDRSLEPRDNSIVIALLDNEFTVKRIKKQKGNLYLVPENSRFKPTRVNEDMDFEIWGVVTHAIHKT